MLPTRVLLKGLAVGGFMIAASVGMAPAAGAGPSTTTAVSVCQGAPAVDPTGDTQTRGECVTTLKWILGNGSNDNSFIAGVCGFEYNRGLTGATNKGQCVTAFQ